MTIVLDKPEQISAWVLLSRRHQIQLHLKGYTQKGLLKSVNQTLGTNYHRVKDLVVPVEFALSQAGVEIDYKLVNINMLEIVRPNEVFQDMGIYDSPADITPDSYLGKMYAAGRMEVVLTTEAVRPPNGNLLSPA